MSFKQVSMCSGLGQLGTFKALSLVHVPLHSRKSCNYSYPSCNKCIITETNLHYELLVSFLRKDLLLLQNWHSGSFVNCISWLQDTSLQMFNKNYEKNLHEKRFEKISIAKLAFNFGDTCNCTWFLATAVYTCKAVIKLFWAVYTVYKV